MSAAPHGLPDALPAGERLLWQGRPDWRALARHAFGVVKLAAYFAVLVTWLTVSSVRNGATPGEIGAAVLQGVALSAVPLGLVVAYAWAVARSTAYTITDRRVVLRVGLALPITVNLPFSRITAADLNRRGDGSGDIALTLEGTGHLPYLALWPHARPWRLARPQPMLRGLAGVQPVVQILARALAASAEMAVPVVPAALPAKLPVPQAPIAA